MSYTPPKVWDYQKIGQNGGKFAGINRPGAGARHEQSLPTGERAYQLYTLNTPNGIKVNILLEELIALGKIDGYDAYKIDIGAGDQFGSGFVALNPNSKIPVLLDTERNPPLPVFESGAILWYLANKHGAFLPTDLAQNTRCLSWLMWQMGSAPFVGGGFGHFYAYAPFADEYAIDRYTMETKRQLDVLDRHLADRAYMVDEYSVADMAIYPWYGRLRLGELYVGENYNAAEFLAVDDYKNLGRWARQIAQRPAVQAAQNRPLAPLVGG